jgi:hypothetical protein
LWKYNFRNNILALNEIRITVCILIPHTTHVEKILLLKSIERRFGLNLQKEEFEEDTL